MEKFVAIEALYKEKSDINLKIVTLEEKIARSADYAQNHIDLAALAGLHYQEFMVEYEIKAVLDAPKPTLLNKLLNRV